MSRRKACRYVQIIACMSEKTTIASRPACADFDYYARDHCEIQQHTLGAAASYPKYYMLIR